MDISTVVNPKALGLDATTAAILLGVATYIWQSIRKTVMDIPSRVLKFFSYSIKIGPLSAVGVPVADYLLLIEGDPRTKMLFRPRNFMPQSMRSSSSISSTRRRRSLDAHVDSDVIDESGDGELSLGIGTYMFWHPDYGLFQLSISNREDKPDNSSNASAFYDLVRYNSGEQIDRTLRFYGCSAAKLRLTNFLRDAIACYRKSIADKRNCFVHRGGCWVPTLELKNTARRLDGIFSDNDVANTLYSSVSSFLDSKQIYVDAGIPYHYGVMLYGPPGTGKTTLAQSIANSLGVPLYVFQFKSTMDDNDIIDSLRSVPPRSIVLFEDIDCNTEIASARSNIDTGSEQTPNYKHSTVDVRKSILTVSDTKPSTRNSRGGATLSGLLNSLDGVFAPSDVVYIFTTNDIDSLDAGLLRRGRIDDPYHMDYISKDTQVRMAEYLGCPASIVESLPERAAPCDVQDLALRYLRQNK